MVSLTTYMNECYICCDAKPSELLRVCPCHNVIHRECFARMLVHLPNPFVCPTCRRPFRVQLQPKVCLTRGGRWFVVCVSVAGVLNVWILCSFFIRHLNPSLSFSIDEFVLARSVCLVVSAIIYIHTLGDLFHIRVSLLE